jgi:KaiC/GvpD/RAD55 family RecA-like ATPase/DNA-binding response OmpR family regulator
MSLPPELEPTLNTATTPTKSRSDQRIPADVALPLAAPVDELAENVEVGGEEIVPARSRPTDRQISGIDLIDFGVGGLLPNKVYVVKGGIGVGKSILGLQYLTRGLEHDEPGVLITDQKPENVLTQARSIGFPIDEAVQRNQLSILNPSSRYFELVESPADIQAIVEELTDYIREIGAKRLVIDPIYTLINTQYSAHFALMVTQSLVNALEDLPTTTLLIAGDEENNPELNPIIRMLEHNAFGVIDLSQDTSTGGRLMRLSKLRYANNDNLSAHYRILNGRGLINYRGEGEQVSDITQPWEETAQISRSVLLIGAHPDTIRRVKESLGDTYQVHAESDLHRGIERARSEKPGLVLVTPSRSIAAVSAILDLAQNSSSSLAFLSPATNRQSDKVLYLRAGADDFITEPFSTAELRARVEALVRRSGRRLNTRDSGVAITPEELSSLMSSNQSAPRNGKRPVLTVDGNDVKFDPEFNERLERNIAAVSKLDTPFALYWIKSKNKDAELNQSLAKLSRQEDILCHNRNGEFVAILSGTDRHGVRGFEKRLDEKLGDRLTPDRVNRGYRLYNER